MSERENIIGLPSADQATRMAISNLKKLYPNTEKKITDTIYDAIEKGQRNCIIHCEDDKEQTLIEYLLASNGYSTYLENVYQIRVLWQ